MAEVRIRWSAQGDASVAVAARCAVEQVIAHRAIAARYSVGVCAVEASEPWALLHERARQACGVVRLARGGYDSRAEEQHDSHRRH